MEKKEAIFKTLEKNNDSINTESELLILLEEYKSLRAEMISLQEFTRQNITTIYAGIGLIGAISSFLIQNNLKIVFLLFPFLFYSLALTSVKYALAGIHIGNYIKTNLTPQIIRSLNRVNPKGDYSHIFYWEKSKSVVKRYGFLLLPANGAHYWLPLLAAVFSVSAYFVFPSTATNTQLLDFFTISMLSINGLTFLYTIAVGLYAGYSR